jgi:peptide-methionine (S)-S-oxide reductase
MNLFTRREPELPAPGRALAGSDVPLDPGERHFVNGNPLKGPWPEGMAVAIFAAGCFWGAEELYWQTPGVHSTAVGYAGGETQNPTYEQVCSGRTGHSEAVLVVFDPNLVSYEALLRIFWEHHDPTQGMRQGNDVGTQYRSAIFTTTAEQHAAAVASAARFAPALAEQGYGAITTEIAGIDPARDFFHAEQYHQQYLAKNPNGYRCHSTTGVAFPSGED